MLYFQSFKAPMPDPRARDEHCPHPLTSAVSREERAYLDNLETSLARPPPTSVTHFLQPTRDDTSYHNHPPTTFPNPYSSNHPGHHSAYPYISPVRQDAVTVKFLENALEQFAQQISSTYKSDIEAQVSKAFQTNQGKVKRHMDQDRNNASSFHEDHSNKVSSFVLFFVYSTT